MRRIKPFILSANEVLGLLSSQAHGNVDGLLTEDGRIDLAKARRTGAIRIVKRLHFNKDGYIQSVELHDAQSALVHLGRNHKLFTDKVESDLSAEAQEQLDKRKQIIRAIMQKYLLTPEQAEKIMANVDSDLESQAVN